MLKQQLLQRDAELKRTKTKLKEADDKAKIAGEANVTSDSRLAAAHGERDSAKRALSRATAEVVAHKQVRVPPHNYTDTMGQSG